VPDKVYGFLGLVPEDQRPTVDYSKLPQRIFLDVVRIVLRTYWAKKPTEEIHNTRFYGILREYLRNMMELAWNMRFPNHDQRGLVDLFKQIAEVEDWLSREMDGPGLMESIEEFGYDSMGTGATDNEPGVLMGFWWMQVDGEIYYHACRAGLPPVRQMDAWSFLNDIQLQKPWFLTDEEKAEEVELQRAIVDDTAHPDEEESSLDPEREAQLEELAQNPLLFRGLWNTM
jgi:hypothetical protein